MSLSVDGKLFKKFDTENKTSTFQAREFVLLMEDGNYPQYVKFQLTQDRCNLIDNLNVNEKIKVWFDLRGREWNEKFFTNLNAWKIEKLDQQDQAPGNNPEDSFPGPNDYNETFTENFEDDLPF